MVSIFDDKLLRFFLLAIVFLLPVHTAYIFSFNPESSQYTRITISLLDLFVLAALTVSIPLIMQKRIQFVLPRYVALPLLFFVLSSLLSFLFSPHKDIALLYLVHVCQGVALFLVLSSGYVSKNMIASVFVMSGVLQALFAMQQFAAQEIAANAWLGISAHSAATLGDSVVEGNGFRILRAYGGFAHPNMLAAFLSGSFLSGLYLYGTALTQKRRSIFFIASMLIFLGLLLTFSRSAWLALLVSIGLAFSLVLRSRTFWQNDIAKQFLVFLVGAIAVVSIFSFSYWQPVSTRMGLQGPLRLETRSIQERTSYLQDALARIGQYPLGVGIGQYIPSLMDRDLGRDIKAPPYTYQPVHSHFVLILAELGFFGFLSFLVFFFSLLLYIVKQRQYIAIAAVAFLFFSGLFDHYYWTLQSGVFLWWSLLGFHSKI